MEKIEAKCETCEYNFEGICIGALYGEQIEANYVCFGWHVSEEAYIDWKQKMAKKYGDNHDYNETSLREVINRIVRCHIEFRM